MRYYLQKIFLLWRKMWLGKFWMFVLRPFLYRKHMYYLHNNILLEKHKAIYFNIPKVASTSIRKIIVEILNLNQKWIDLSVLHKRDFPFIKRKYLNTKYNNYIKFCFVRNPYDRLVSCYNNRVLRESVTKWGYIKWVHVNFLSLWNFYAWMSFREFVEEICKIDDINADPHFKSQYKILSYKWKIIDLNFIWKFENLNKDFNKLTNLLWIKEKIKLPHLMKSEHKHYRSYYDNATKKLVEERYKKDLELFNYKF